MLNARQIAFRALPPERLSHIQYLSQSVGSGKTAAVINDIRDNQNQSYIYVLPTRQLAQEIKNRLDVALINDGQGENVHLIISDDDEPQVEPIRLRVLNAIRARRPNENHVLVITTETFRNVLPEIEGHHKSAYSVFIDEGIDPIDFVKFSVRDLTPFLEHISFDEDESLSLNDAGRDLFRTVAFNPNQLAHVERQELDVPDFKKLAKLLVSDIYDVYGCTEAQTFKGVAFLRPDHFLPFRSVTMIVAIFDQSLLALFWTEKYGIEFREYETQHEMFDTHRIKGPQMRIHYLLHPDDGASRLNLERHWQTGRPNASERLGERAIDRAALAVEERFHDMAYCWAANSYFSNHGRILSGSRMPPKCAGLDIYRRNDIVVSMLSMNPEPWVKNMVTRHVGIGDNEFYELWRISYTYQTIGRCSIRDRESNRPVEVVVVSRDCAERIAALFEGAQIVGQLTDLPSYTAMRRRRGRARNPSPYSGADDTAWSRYQGAHPDTELTKEGWFEAVRIPDLIRRNRRNM